jgi:hypothetical protein
MGTESNLQAYWQAGAFYLAVTIALLLVLNWVIIGALAEHPACKAKLRKVALTDAIFFAFIPPVFYLLAPFASGLMSALGVAAMKYNDFVSLVHISIALGLAGYLFLVDAVYLSQSPGRKAT